MMKTNGRQASTVFTAVEVENIRFRATRGHFSHLVHCRYTGLQVFIVLFRIIFRSNKYVHLNHDVSISGRLADVCYTQVTVL